MTRLESNYYGLNGFWLLVRAAGLVFGHGLGYRNQNNILSARKTKNQLPTTKPAALTQDHDQIILFGKRISDLFYNFYI